MYLSHLLDYFFSSWNLFLGLCFLDHFDICLRISRRISKFKYINETIISTRGQCVCHMRRGRTYHRWNNPEKNAINFNAPNSVKVIHVVEIFLGISIVSCPKAKNKRGINRQYTYVQSALFPEPKDSWGLFGKPHFTDSTCFSIPAAH